MKSTKNNFLKDFLKYIAVMAFLLSGLIASCKYLIEQNGGIKQIIIEAGKEVKEIKKEIDNS